MSFEFQAKIDQPVPPHSLPRLKNYIVQNTAFDVVRDMGAEFGLTNASKKDCARVEDITVSIDANRVYIAFHSPNRNQREAFLAIATKALEAEELLPPSTSSNALGM